MIFYFSATGNTKWAAKKVADRTNDKLISIAEVIDSDCHFELSPDENIGFCFPVHAWRPPIIVERFAKKLSFSRRLSPGQFSFLLLTAGNDIGETVDIFQRAISHTGIQLSASYSLLMPDTYVGFSFMHVDSDEKRLGKLNQSVVQLRDIQERIANKIPGSKYLLLSRAPKTDSRLLGKIFIKCLPLIEKAFRVEDEKCIKCGICVDVCPTKALEGGVGRTPRWKREGKCLSCFSCYHHCPKHAIQYLHVTKNEGQYYFKGIK